MCTCCACAPAPACRPARPCSPSCPFPHIPPPPFFDSSPEDSYAYIPGAVACVRCTKGVPEACIDGECSNVASSPATSIVSVSKMVATGSNSACDLAGAWAVAGWLHA